MRRATPKLLSTSRRRSARSLGVLALALAILPSCITERTTPPTYGVHTTTARTSSPVKSGDPKTPVTLPEGPIAHPVATDASRSSRVRVGLMDLGTVPYDGQVLPLVSPDGRFIAVQDGEAPTWPTLLAAPGAEVPHPTRLVAYSLPDPQAANLSGQAPGARAVEWSEPRTGMLLGRSCDTTGFLVEAPQPDGSRWIGRISWVSGSLTWLVQGGNVNAYAALGPDGELAYCRRDIDSNQIELVLRPSAGDEREFVAVPPGGGYLWPAFSDETGVVYALSLVAGNAELHALKVPQKGDPPVLAVVGRQPLLRNADVASLYQITAAMQVPLPRVLTNANAPRGNRQKDESFDKLIFFHTGQGRVCVYDRRVAMLVPLFPGSFAAMPFLANEGDPASPQSGYLITTQNGLEYVSWSQKSDFERLRGVPASTEGGVSVIKGAYIPRLTSDLAWRVVLVGPAPGTASPRIHLFRLKIEAADIAIPTTPKGRQ